MALSHAGLIRRSLQSSQDQDFKGNKWGARHANEWMSARGDRGADHGMAIVGMITALAQYADAHKTRFQSRIGDDGVLGPPWADSVRNVISLLNGDLGQLDGGTLDRLLREMLRLEGFDAD